MDLPPECLAELEAARNELTASLTRAEHRHAGFKRGPEELIRLPDGDYNEREVIKQTYYECYHCGGSWHDTPETRRALDESSHYVASNPNALPENVGFSWPAWAGQRLAWGGEYIMLGYLRAKQIQEKLGNIEPLKQWYQKRAARPWSGDLSGRAAERPASERYDITKDKLPGEKLRISATDCQFNLTHMIYLAVAVGDGVPDRVLHYEWVKAPSGLNEHEARESCKRRVRELDKEFGIQEQNSMKDGGHRIDLVREWAAEDAVWGRGRDESGRIRPQWFTYGILIGDDAVSYQWKHPGRKATWERFKQFQYANVEAFKDGKRVRIPVHHRLWSNWSIKQIVERWRDGNSAPKIQIHEKFLADGGREGLWAQLTSERPLPWKGRPGKLRYDNEGRPNHAWDCLCMIFVRKDEQGLLNSFATPEADEGQART
jgi:hypothetical protein